MNAKSNKTFEEEVIAHAGFQISISCESFGCNARLVLCINGYRFHHRCSQLCWLVVDIPKLERAEHITSVTDDYCGCVCRDKERETVEADVNYQADAHLLI